MKKSLAVSIVAFCIALPGSFGAINDGLLAYYAFEGNALDGSGHGYHGSNYTGMVGYGAGRFGMAAWFDAQSCLRLPQARLLDGASNATISAWIWFSSGQGGQILGAGEDALDSTR